MNSGTANRTLGLIVLAAFAAASAGCGGGGPKADRPATAKVSGKVTYKGSPVDGATVTFHGAAGARSAFGRTDATGLYELTTFESKDGAVPGAYRVTVQKTEVSGGSTLPEDHPDYGKEPIAESTVKELLPAKYADPAASGLTATVGTGENDFPFDLQD